MNLAEIIKEQDFFKQLRQSWQSGTFPSATMFFCEDDVTSKCALVLSALMMEFPTFDLLSQDSAPFVRISGGADLDVKVYPKADKMLVSDANEIVAEAFAKPVNLPYKIFLLQNLDVSTDEAQNKLLKILEEPPKNVYFLISAKSETRVLATIKSRCKKVTINPLSMQQMAEICSNRLAVALGGGFVGKTMALAQNEQLEEIADFAISLFCEMKSSKDVVRFSTTFLDFRSEIALVLRILCMAAEDLLKLKCESENLCLLLPIYPGLRDAEPEFSVQALCEICKLVARLQEKLEFNANQTVAIDNFLLKILEVKYLCK